MKLVPVGTVPLYTVIVYASVSGLVQAQVVAHPVSTGDNRTKVVVLNTGDLHALFIGETVAID